MPRGKPGPASRLKVCFVALIGRWRDPATTFKPEATELKLSETEVRSVGFLFDL
ncbi:hypothetical protein [Mesorhizobium sp. M0830]|uniref:hypothetical protein n=1 Tax=Mesorhizobium sp. M0830 TaxID=2957008 RepID=UPI0033397348